MQQILNCYCAFIQNVSSSCGLIRCFFNKMYKNKDNLNFRNVNKKIGMYKDIIDLLVTVFKEYLWKSLRDLLWDFYIDYKGSLILQYVALSTVCQKTNEQKNYPKNINRQNHNALTTKRQY